MRAVVQRVTEASIRIEGNEISKIGAGVLVLLGIEESDDEKDIHYMADKICNLRIFCDENDKMNLSLLEVEGELLIVSQFTLYGDCRKGRRPSYIEAARPEFAEKLYEDFVSECRKKIKIVKTGQFQTDMKVSLTNDGPVTLLIDSKKNF